MDKKTDLGQECTALDGNKKEVYENLHEKMYSHAAEIKNRKMLDDALDFFRMHSIDDGSGVIDWLIYSGGLLESYEQDFIEAGEHDKYYNMLGSRLSVFEMRSDGLVDIFTGKIYPIAIDYDGLAIARVYEDKFIIDYQPIANVSSEKAKEMVGSSDHIMDNWEIQLWKLSKALDFEVPEEVMLYQGTYEIKSEPLELFQSLGFTLFKEDGIYVIYKEDEFMAEIEINGEILLLLCNSPGALENLDNLVDGNGLDLVRKEVFTAEELIAADNSFDNN